MNPFKTITNVVRKVHDGLAGTTIETGTGEFLSEIGFQDIGSSLSKWGDSSIDEATEATRQVPLIGESLSSVTHSTLSGIRNVSRFIGKGTAYICKANIVRPKE